MLSHIWGIFSSSSSFFSFVFPFPPTSRPISQPRGPYPSLEAQIPVLRPKSQPQGPNPNPKPFLGNIWLKIQTGNMSWRLKFGMELFPSIVSLCARFHSYSPKSLLFMAKKIKNLYFKVLLGDVCQKKSLRIQARS